MSRTSTIRQRGQLTIPAQIRREARLDEGCVVELEVVEDGVLIRPRTFFDADVALDQTFVRDVIETTTAGYAALSADPETWAEELREREVWDITLADGLDDA